MVKRITTTALCLALTLMLLAGCQGAPAATAAPGPVATSAPATAAPAPAATAKPAATAAPATAPPAASIVSAPGVFPIVEKPVTLTFFAPQSANIPDIATNAFTTMYEQKTNVHIEWELAPANALAEKRSISLASGQYPDVYLGAGITREEEMTYGPKGIFIALNDLIDKYNPELQKLYKEDPNIPVMMRAYDGNIYSYINVQKTLHVDLQNRLWLNSTFVKDLGMQTPTTPEELYQVLKAIKDKDPNKNGKPDEIPLVISTVLGNSGLAFLMCPFIYYNGGDGLIVSEDDKVSVSYNTPQWREGLRYMNRLFVDGLLDKTSFSVTGEQVKQLVEAQDAMIVGGLPAMAPSGFANLAGERHKNYDALTPLKGPEGTQVTGWFPYAHGMGALVVTKACKNPEIVARWVDYFYTWEGALTAREGPENTGWKRPAEGTLSYTGEKATWERLTNYGAASNFKWDGIGFPHNMLIHPQQASNNDIYASNGQPARLYQIAKNQYEPYEPKKVFPPLYMSPDVIKDYSKMKTDIGKYVEDYTVRFITGEASLDKDWDAYIANFEKLKLADYIRLSQEAYDTFLKNAN